MASCEEKTGIILTNIGSPATPEPADIKPYLVEFLSDKNLVKVPHIIWIPLLKGVISQTRPKKTAPRYKAIWTPDGPPLLVYSFAQRDALNKRLEAAGIPAVCEVGMRYGSPSIDEAYTILEQAGCKRILGFPLFPQTAYSTVKTCKERQVNVASTHTIAPLYDVVEGYSDNPLYIKAMAASIREAWEYRPGSKLLFSFHSIPLNDVESGDTYLEQSRTSMEKVVRELGIPDEDWAIAYHSRFEDSRAWAAPHPKTVAQSWVEAGTKRIAVVTPGFASDCLESLYDMNIVARQHLENFCGTHGIDFDFTYIPALNDREDHIDLLYDVILQHL